MEWPFSRAELVSPVFSSPSLVPEWVAASSSTPRGRKSLRKACVGTVARKALVPPGDDGRPGNVPCTAVGLGALEWGRPCWLCPWGARGAVQCLSVGTGAWAVVPGRAGEGDSVSPGSTLALGYPANEPKQEGVHPKLHPGEGPTLDFSLPLPQDADVSHLRPGGPCPALLSESSPPLPLCPSFVWETAF